MIASALLTFNSPVYPFRLNLRKVILANFISDSFLLLLVNIALVASGERGVAFKADISPEIFGVSEACLYEQVWAWKDYLGSDRTLNQPLS